MQPLKRLLHLKTAALLIIGTATAQNQNNLSGNYHEPQNGFTITLQQQPGGPLNGDIQGIPLDIAQQHGDTAAGTFWLQGELNGITVQLQPDGNTLYIWLYDLDGTGQIIEHTTEGYMAYRNNAADAPSPTHQPTTPSGQTNSQGAEAALHGNWIWAHQMIPLGTIWTNTTFYPNGAYEEASYTNGQVAHWRTGTYALADGHLTIWVNNHSTQTCYFGGCSPTIQVPSPRNFNIVFLNNDSMTLTEIYPDGTEEAVNHVRQESGLQPQPLVSVLPSPPQSGQAAAGAPSAWPPPAASGMSAPETMESSGFIQGVIRGEGTYVDPNSGSSYDLPLVGEPGSTYYGPGGEEFTYDPITGGWTATDPTGWEYELEEDW